MELARDFVAHTTAKHGDAWKLMHCNNLSAHVANKIKQMLQDGKVFMYFLPEQTIEYTQPTDAG